MLASRIRKRIINGELKAGDKLPPEANLITEFEVSRPTIREAIRILESEGLISVSRGARGGARVNAASTELVTRAAGLALQARNATLKDIYEARALIEPPAARLAAERRSKQASAALRAHIAVEWAAGEDDVLRAKAVAEFHRILLEECGNVALGMVGTALQAVVEQHMELAYRRDRSRQRQNTLKLIQVGLRSHEKLADLIEQGDGPGAEAHWVDHMAKAGSFWVGAVGKATVLDVLE
ncbi:FadR/GntR family transcriptional regulator [Phenylobacterium zucineum]|uniref:FadR/GntR family transcriptional regulator n=1 Tax=Phenylobacterium zucineum TaxID=284016 RepID=UPI0002E4CB36|nr:GntR family transcriptional regulator [Phenylobacterium zucineum]